MKKTLFITVVLFTLTTSLFATENHYDHVINSEITYSINTKDVAAKFESTLLDPESILKVFNPPSVNVTKKVVNGNQFEFIVNRKVLGTVYEFHLLGYLTFERTTGCAPTEQAYLGRIDLSLSGPEITDLISDFTMLICSNARSVSIVNGKSKNALYYKGDKLGFIFEQVTKAVVNDQVNHLFASIKSIIVQKRRQALITRATDTQP